MRHNLVRARHSRRHPLVIASCNPGKLREFRELLADLPFEIVAQGDLGIRTPEETGSSFLENALLKARHASAVSGAAAIADDSGLEVDALGGAPGIYSARYAGTDAGDAANNAKLVAALEAVPPPARSARYRCVLVFVAHASDAAPLIAEGIWEGRILESPRGSCGFGYDPYFWLPELGLTAAELDPAEKNRRSHRGAALRALRLQLWRRGQSSRGPTAPRPTSAEPETRDPAAAGPTAHCPAAPEPPETGRAAPEPTGIAPTAIGPAANWPTVPGPTAAGPAAHDRSARCR